MLRNINLIPLSHDHQRALGLCVLVERSLLAEPSPHIVTLHATRIVDQFDAEIQKHFELEENILFPALADLPSLAILVGELTAEHAALTALVSKLRANPELGAVQEFCRLLPPHIRKEERLLFQRVQELLAPSQLDRLGPALNTRKSCRLPS